MTFSDTTEKSKNPGLHLRTFPMLSMLARFSFRWGFFLFPLTSFCVSSSQTFSLLENVAAFSHNFDCL